MNSVSVPYIAKFNVQYFILSKVYIDEGGGGAEGGGIKLYYGLSACTGDNSLAKARGLSPRTGGQTKRVEYRSYSGQIVE